MSPVVRTNLRHSLSRNHHPSRNPENLYVFTSWSRTTSLVRKLLSHRIAYRSVQVCSSEDRYKKWCFLSRSVWCTKIGVSRSLAKSASRNKTLKWFQGSSARSAKSSRTTVPRSPSRIISNTKTSEDATTKSDKGRMCFPSIRASFYVQLCSNSTQAALRTDL